MAWECSRGHRGTGPGTCYTNGCYRHFKEVEEHSARSAKTLLREELSTLNLVHYTDLAKNHLHHSYEGETVDC